MVALATPYAGGMSAEKVVAAFNMRLQRAGYPEFALWIPIAMGVFTLAAAIVAAGQRADQGALLQASALMFVALAPGYLTVVTIKVPWPIVMAFTIAATTVLIVRYPVDYDFAMFVWVMLVGHIGATESFLRSVIATAIAAVALSALGLAGLVEGSALWLAALIAGGDIGIIMRYQQVRLDQERRTHRDHEAAAVLQERQRIAREVHDVIAHSLSVTMLHLTAARRSLEEDREAGVDDAVDALREAEALGRAAMSDIRHTVGLLGQESGTPMPVPDLRDLGRLVEDFRAAGLEVELDVRGDPADVPASAGLGLYRIAQESLANVAKHQPGAHASVLLDCRPGARRLVITNTLPAATRPRTGGSGLRGMRERAELLGGSLTVGRRSDRWVVEVELPTRSDADGADSCSFGLGRRTAEAT